MRPERGRAQRAVQPDDDRPGVGDDVQNASTVWPLSVRPDASTIVPETISGRRMPAASCAASTPKIAALPLSVSKIVSMRRMSAPPSIRPSAASW